jgi:hypothetical protein
MTPRKPPEPATPDAVPDWFMGGERRRLLLQTIASRRRRGWTVAELREKADCGQATAYEVVRVLSDIGLLEPPDSLHRYRLNENHRLAEPLRSLLKALLPYSSRAVQRPARGKRRT